MNALSHLRDVSRTRLSASPSSGYGDRVPAISTEGAALATLLKESRKRRGVSAEEVIDATSVSRATYFRWEAGEVSSPNLRQLREVLLFLRVPPALAGIALGLLTPEDLAIEPAEQFDPAVVEIGRILADDLLPASSRAALHHSLQAALNLWRAATSMPEPKEPRGADLVRRARTTR